MAKFSSYRGQSGVGYYPNYDPIEEIGSVNHNYDKYDEEHQNFINKQTGRGGIDYLTKIYDGYDDEHIAYN